MYRPTFGTVEQIRFNNPSDYYEFLGYLSRNDGSTELVWENNDEQGAWGQEGRIHFRVQPPPILRAVLSHTAGTGRVISRVNCNEFVEHIVTRHGFDYGSTQDQATVRATVPSANHADFDRGLSM